MPAHRGLTVRVERREIASEAVVAHVEELAQLALELAGVATHADYLDIERRTLVAPPDRHARDVQQREREPLEVGRRHLHPREARPERAAVGATMAVAAEDLREARRQLARALWRFAGEIEPLGRQRAFGVQYWSNLHHRAQGWAARPWLTSRLRPTCAAAAASVLSLRPRRRASRGAASDVSRHCAPAGTASHPERGARPSRSRHPHRGCRCTIVNARPLALGS